jgi:hypothetical protein
MIRPPEKLRNSSGPRTYKEALTDVKTAIFMETYPEGKITEDNQNYIIEELARVFCGAAHLKSYRWEGGALIYLCTNQQSGQWLVKATDKNLPKPVKVEPAWPVDLSLWPGGK